MLIGSSNPFERNKYQLKKNIYKQIATEEIDIPINSDSLKAYIAKYHKENINDIQLRYLLKILDAVKIKSIKEFDMLIKRSNMSNINEVLKSICHHDKLHSPHRAKRFPEILCAAAYIFAIIIDKDLTYKDIKKIAPAYPHCVSPISIKKMKGEISGLKIRYSK